MTRAWWIGPVLASAILYACSGSSDGSVATDDAGTTLEGGSSGNPPPGDAGPDTANCRAQGPYPGKVAKSVARPGVTGGVAWQNPNDGLAPDGKFASADLTSASETEELIVTDFGFDVPADVHITGIEVELKRQAPSGGVIDGLVFLTLNGSKSPNSHYLDIAWPTSIIGTHKYGNELDDWAMPVTPSDVANPTFGATIYAKKVDGGGVADIDAVQIYVNYCPP
jgi:hypothetical protein